MSVSKIKVTDADNVRVKDSGTREEMETGSRRDSREGKGRFDLLPWPVLRRDALLYERGACKYSQRNWELGQKQSRYFDSAIRHLYQYIMGDRSEDHLASARFNIAGMMFNEEMIKIGRLSEDLYDMPDYTPVLSDDTVFHMSLVGDVGQALHAMLDATEEGRTITIERGGEEVIRVENAEVVDFHKDFDYE